MSKSFDAGNLKSSPNNNRSSISTSRVRAALEDIDLCTENDSENTYNMSGGDAVIALKNARGDAADGSSEDAVDNAGDDKQTASQMFFNVVKAYLGAGMLLIPYGLYKGGFG